MFWIEKSCLEILFEGKVEVLNENTPVSVLLRQRTVTCKWKWTAEIQSYDKTSPSYDPTVPLNYRVTFSKVFKDLIVTCSGSV